MEHCEQSDAGGATEPEAGVAATALAVKAVCDVTNADGGAFKLLEAATTLKLSLSNNTAPLESDNRKK